MQVMRYGDDDDLQEMYKRDIWDSIREKHSMVHMNIGQGGDAENTFLNMLNEQEYAEFVKSKPNDQSVDKYMHSGLASELLQADKIKEKVSYQAKELRLLEESVA